MFSHIDPTKYDQQLLKKQHEMAELFAQFNPPTMEVFTSDPIHYRQRAEFRIWHEGDDLYYIMFDSATKEKFKVENFPVASQLINQLMKALLVEIKSQPILRHKLFQVDFLTTLSGQAIMSLLYHKPLDDEWQTQANQLKQRLSSIAPLHIIGRARKQKWIVDRDHVIEKLTVGEQSYVYQQVENSFTQPNGKVNEKMLLWAQQATLGRGGDLIELYCGNGNFSIALAQNFDRVLGTEISKTSVNALLLSATFETYRILEDLDTTRISLFESPICRY